MIIRLYTILDSVKKINNDSNFQVTFEGHWSRQTHPKDYPNNEWLTHFSDIIGASHSTDFRVWEYGGIASDGLRQVAEWGSTRQLEGELKSQVSREDKVTFY